RVVPQRGQRVDPPPRGQRQHPRGQRLLHPQRRHEPGPPRPPPPPPRPAPPRPPASPEPFPQPPPPRRRPRGGARLGRHRRRRPDPEQDDDGDDQANEPTHPGIVAAPWAPCRRGRGGGGRGAA